MLSLEERTASARVTAKATSTKAAANAAPDVN